MADETDDPEDAGTGGLDDAAWDGQTDAFITEIDEGISTKYGISLRTLLTDAASYAQTKDIADTIKSLKSDIDSYFDGLMEDLKEEKQQLTKEMEDADALSIKLDQAISSKAAVARVPYIKPVSVDYGTRNQETILIEKYDNGVDALIAKFVNISNYIANVSAVYKKYTLGSWLFSGDRSYILAVNRQESMVMTVETAQEYIDNAIDGAAAVLSKASS